AVTLRPVADEQEPYARTARHQAPERAEQDFVALYRIEPGHTAKHQRVWQKAESPATPRGPLVQLIDVNSVHDDRAPPWPAHAEALTRATIRGAADAHAELVARKTANEVIDLPWPAAERGRGEKLEDADQPAARSIVAVIDVARLGLQWPFEPL